MVERFRREVLSFGAEACLPSNLNDEWLDLLKKELEFLLKTRSKNSPKKPNCTFAAIFSILLHRYGGCEGEVGLHELFELTKTYLVELTIERAFRQSEMRYKPATIETIFLRQLSDVLDFR